MNGWPKYSWRLARACTWEDCFRAVGISGIVFALLGFHPGAGALHWPAWVFAFLLVMTHTALQKSTAIGDSEFELIRFGGGTGAYRFLINCKKSLLVTHFSEVVPSTAYVELQKELLDGGDFRMTRYLPKSANVQDPKFAWISQFDSYEPKGKYVEKSVNNITLPVDIFVFDNELIAFYLPSEQADIDFDLGVLVRDHRVAEMVRVAVERCLSK